MKRKSLWIAILFSFVFVLFAGVLEAAEKKYTIVTIPKVHGSNWSQRIDSGVKRFAKDTGHNSFMQGPAKMDVVLQVQIVEDMIAQKVDALCVIPYSPEALEPVFKKAMEQGIIVITHEADNQKNMHYDIEAFDNPAYGIHLMDAMAKGMNQEGEYAVMVGSLTSKTHNQWADAAIEHQKKAYPKMTMVGGGKIETMQVAYDKAKELLKAFPNLKGIQGSDASDAPNAGLAVEELGLENKVTVVGTALVSQSRPYLDSGAVKMISFWDPGEAAYVMNRVATMLLEKKEIKDGMDLGVAGYDKVKVNGRLIIGSAWIDVTKENMDKYSF